MSDDRLRELERRWKETGSADDEALYLVERVRVGRLTRQLLELAVHCGHEGATKALGFTPSVTTEPSVWVDELGRWGSRYVAAAAGAFALHTLWMLENSSADPAHPSARLALQGAEQGVACGQTRLSLLESAYIVLSQREWRWSYHLDHACQAALQAAREADELERAVHALHAPREAIRQALEEGLTPSALLTPMRRAVAIMALGAEANVAG